MKTSSIITAAILGISSASAGPCTMGIYVTDQTVTVGGGTHMQYCEAQIWDQDDVSKNSVTRTEIGCSAGSTAQLLWGGWHYNFRMNTGTDEAGKIPDGGSEVAREYIGATVPFNEHYSHTYFGAANVAITNIAYSQVDCPFK